MTEPLSTAGLHEGSSVVIGERAALQRLRDDAGRRARSVPDRVGRRARARPCTPGAASSRSGQRRMPSCASTTGSGGRHRAGRRDRGSRLRDRAAGGSDDRRNARRRGDHGIHPLAGRRATRDRRPPDRARAARRRSRGVRSLGAGRRHRLQPAAAHPAARERDLAAVCRLRLATCLAPDCPSSPRLPRSDGGRFGARLPQPQLPVHRRSVAGDHGRQLPRRASAVARSRAEPSRPSTGSTRASSRRMRRPPWSPNAPSCCATRPTRRGWPRSPPVRCPGCGSAAAPTPTICASGSAPRPSPRGSPSTIPSNSSIDAR